MTTIFEKRRSFVNQEFAMKVRGKSISNAKKTKLFKQLWRKAKLKFK